MFVNTSLNTNGVVADYRAALADRRGAVKAELAYHKTARLLYDKYRASLDRFLEKPHWITRLRLDNARARYWDHMKAGE